PASLSIDGLGSPSRGGLSWSGGQRTLRVRVSTAKPCRRLRSACSRIAIELSIEIARFIWFGIFLVYLVTFASPRFASTLRSRQPLNPAFFFSQRIPFLKN